MSEHPKNLLACGIVAGPLFLAVWLVQALTRDGFDPGRHPISLLSLGGAGWIQILNFVTAGVLYVATAVVTGLAAIMLTETLRGPMERLELHGLARTSVLLIAWQMIVLALFLLTAAGGWSIFLTGGSLIAIVAAVVLGGLLPLVLLAVGGLRPRPAMTALAAVLILVGGLLLRAGIVMGPQHG